MTFIDILGYVAAVGTTGAFIPQVYKVYKTKKTEDLSLGTFLLFCIGIVLWTVFGVLIKSLPVILANSITFVLAFYILVMKIKHK
ncbi:MAG: SemiSWEET transporter [bacterium]